VTRHFEGPLQGESGAEYLADPALLQAAEIALTLGAPLLLTGEAGCGKTDFAWAAAGALTPGRAPLLCQVRSESRARDLLYHYDAVARFADAQAHGEEGREARLQARSAGPYLALEALGAAIVAPDRRVVLIDEIDKAPRDLPNDLLRELDKWAFRIAELKPGETSGDLRAEMQRPPHLPPPFVVITSNVERQLPEPFLRRCVFFHIRFPDEDRLVRILAKRIEATGAGGVEPGRVAPGRLQRAARILLRLRDVRDLVKRPGTAELLHWEDALWRAFASPDRGGLPEPEKVSWKALPGLECLLKLREDLETVGAA
jgi:MoxR-like ATPase